MPSPASPVPFVPGPCGLALDGAALDRDGNVEAGVQFPPELRAQRAAILERVRRGAFVWEVQAVLKRWCLVADFGVGLDLHTSAAILERVRRGVFVSASTRTPPSFIRHTRVGQQRLSVSVPNASVSDPNTGVLIQTRARRTLKGLRVGRSPSLSPAGARLCPCSSDPSQISG
eukprot:3424556-Rhodomonas_salina.1